MVFTAPVLLIAWKRPELTRQVINSLRDLAPERMYVACDGPRSTVADDFEKIVATRRVIDADIDWPCQLERLNFDMNQGCRMGVIQAIN